MEFKGSKGKWKRVKLEQTEFYTERNEIQYGNDGECVAEFVQDDYDALLISKAPEMLEEINESIKDLLCIQASVYQSSKIDNKWDGIYELIQSQIDRKKQLIKEATEV